MSSIKEKILAWVKAVEKAKRKDPECQKFQRIIRENGNGIGSQYAKIHNETYGSQEEMNEIMMDISRLAQGKREAEESYKELMESKFSNFKSEYENIYELAISEEGIDHQTLNHVLGVYSQFEGERISANQGMNQGIEYMKRKFDLPEDFLTSLPEDSPEDLPEDIPEK